MYIYIAVALHYAHSRIIKIIMMTISYSKGYMYMFPPVSKNKTQRKISRRLHIHLSNLTIILIFIQRIGEINCYTSNNTVNASKHSDRE